MLNKPSVTTFFFGADREVDIPYREHLSLPRPEDLPLPNGTWMHCQLEISRPFEGEKLFLCVCGGGGWLACFTMKRAKFRKISARVHETLEGCSLQSLLSPL